MVRLYFVNLPQAVTLTTTFATTWRGTGEHIFPVLVALTWLPQKSFTFLRGALILWPDHSSSTDIRWREGTAEGNWAVDTDSNGQAALQAALLGGTEVALKLYVDDTHYYSGQAFVSNMSTGVEAAGKVEVSFDFTFNGEVSYN